MFCQGPLRSFERALQGDPYKLLRQPALTSMKIRDSRAQETHRTVWRASGIENRFQGEELGELMIDYM